jgi:hypothetical protein
MSHQVAPFSLVLSFQARPLCLILLRLQSHGTENTPCFSRLLCRTMAMGNSSTRFNVQPLAAV